MAKRYRPDVLIFRIEARIGENMPLRAGTKASLLGTNLAGLRIGLLLVYDGPEVNRFGQRQISNPSHTDDARLPGTLRDLRAPQVGTTGDRPNQTPVSLDWWADQILEPADCRFDRKGWRC